MFGIQPFKTIKKYVRGLFKLVITHLKYKLGPIIVKFKKAIYDPSFKKKTFSDEAHHIFFGYYDINPFDHAETKLLAIKLDAPLSTPNQDSVAKIGYYDLTNKKMRFVEIGQSYTWNWQQGCRLQWCPNSDNPSVFYNVLLDDHYGAVFQELMTRSILRTIDYPIYDLSSTGYWGLSLNFSRLQRLRPGYGYVNLSDTTQHYSAPENDGVWLVEVSKNQSQLLFSLASLASLDPLDSMANAQHYINHLSFNPSGSSFLFFHLWLDRENKRHSRLFTADTKGGRLTLQNTGGSVSHYTWLSDEKLVVTVITSSNQTRYMQYHRYNGFEKIIGKKILNTDGHPTFIKDGQSLITDTYPDAFREQKLFRFNSQTGKKTIIDRVYLPPVFEGEVRCDLHPRPSRSGNKVCADIVVSNMRAVRVIDLVSSNNN